MDSYYWQRWMLYKNRSVLDEQNVSLKYSSENIIYQRGPPFRLTSDSFGDSLGSPSEIFFSFEFNWYFVPLECHISQKAICWLICRFFFFYFLKYLFLKKTFPIMRKQSELNSHYYLCIFTSMLRIIVVYCGLMQIWIFNLEVLSWK